jgi:hypothetical protein
LARSGIAVVGSSVCLLKATIRYLDTLLPHTSHTVQPLGRCFETSLEGFMLMNARQEIVTNVGRSVERVSVLQVVRRRLPEVFYAGDSDRRGYVVWNVAR